MLDLHCHILPGIDDGARTIEDSIMMARAAVDEGITHILATPHHKNRDWINEKSKVLHLVQELQNEIDDNNLPLTIFPGQEIRIYGEILEGIENDEILFIDELQQYILIEFPTSTVPAFTERLFYDLQSNGVTPIIVHPERNRAILEKPEILKEFIDRGALSQLTAASYTGGFGKKIQKLSSQLIEANLVHFIASDAHNTTNRSFHLKEAYEKLTKEFGEVKNDYFIQNTKDLINGDPLNTPTASSITKKKFWFF